MTKEFHYTQRATTPEWEEGYEKLYGQRCIKHPQSRLIDGRCKECDWQKWENREDEYSEKTIQAGEESVGRKEKKRGR